MRNGLANKRPRSPITPKLWPTLCASGLFLRTLSLSPAECARTLPPVSQPACGAQFGRRAGAKVPSGRLQSARRRCQCQTRSRSLARSPDDNNYWSAFLRLVGGAQQPLASCVGRALDGWRRATKAGRTRKIRRRRHRRPLVRAPIRSQRRHQVRPANRPASAPS